MLYIDEKFVQNISPLVRNFKKKTGHQYNFSCPICGDSKKNKTKARGYLYPNSGRVGLIYKCHNCGASLSFGNLLKKVFPEVYNQYVLERYKNGVTSKKQKHKEIEEMVDSPLFKKKIDLPELISLDELEDEHFAKIYIKSRKIPDEYLKDLYYTKDFSKFISSLFPGKYENLPKNDQRIVLLFLDQDGNIIGAQGRALFQSKMRYVTARANDGVRLVYGLQNHDRAKKTYVVEGPIDSLFLDNSLAVATSDLEGIENRVGKLSNAVYVFDNEPRNYQLVNLIEQAIENNKSVCIWPSDMKGKDINDMILCGFTKEEIQDIIDTNTFSGIEAYLRFNQWKRC